MKLQTPNFQLWRENCKFVAGSLTVVLYGCEALFLTLWEEHKLRIYQKRMLRKIFRTKRKEVTGEWRGLRNEQLYALYSSQNIIWVIKLRRMRWIGHVVHE